MRITDVHWTPVFATVSSPRALGLEPSGGHDLNHHRGRD